MPAGSSGGVITTSSFVTKSARPVTPVVSSTSSIQVWLADANTSAPPSDSIWAASPSEGPKLKVMAVPGWAVSKSTASASKAVVSEEPAKTVSSVVCAASEDVEPRAFGVSSEHPTNARTAHTATTGIRFMRASSPDRWARYQVSWRRTLGKAGGAP